MAHHKRKRPKPARAGCLLCKGHKHPGVKHRGELRGDLGGPWKQERRAHDRERDARDEEGAR